ncbi:MAG: HD-GYP domain-containing protein [Nitriliruptoraceae bacterium]
MFDKLLEHVVPGDVLARTILDQTGRPLLRAGTALTTSYIERLRERGYTAVSIQDGLADDVVPETMVSAQLRQTVSTHVGSFFGQVRDVATERGRGQGGVEDAVADLGEQPLPLADDDGKTAIEMLYEDVQRLINEIVGSETVAGLESLKTHNEYTFQHSVDVAVLGTLLGSRMGLPSSRLRELALGCLLHDLGKLYIEEAILDKPGKLTAEEYGAVKEHPRMGFELIRRMPVVSLLPAHVAYQHHEQQAGSGYPRGLVGDNRIGPRLHEERIGAGHMLLIAEIGAVADVYSAVSSDRPYRPAMAPDEAVDVVDKMAGRHLNREIVQLFTRVVPRYPIGRWVELRGGGLDGARGVVTQLHVLRMDRPTVRVLIDGAGEQLATPEELDLRERHEIGLRSLGAHHEPTR